MFFILGVIGIVFLLAAAVVDRNPSPLRFLSVLALYTVGSSIIEYLAFNYL